MLRPTAARALLLLCAAAAFAAVASASSEYKSPDDGFKQGCPHGLHGTPEQRERAAASGVCSGVYSGCRPRCSAHVPGLPWHWRVPQDPGVRFLHPSETSAADAAAATAAAAPASRPPVLHAAVCPTAAKRAAPGLATEYAVSYRPGGPSLITPVKTASLVASLHDCLTETAFWRLPEGVTEGLLADANATSSAAGGATARGGHRPLLALFNFPYEWAVVERSAWRSTMRG